MRKDGWGRALWYFIRQAQYFVLTAVAGGFLMAAYVWVLRGDELSVQELLRMIPVCAEYGALIVIFSGGVSSAIYWYSTTISFGCLRKHAFWGTVVMDGLVIMESMLFYVVMSALLQTEQTELMYFASMFLMAEGIAKLLGLAFMRWGKAAYVMMIVVIFLVCVIAGFAVGYGGMSGRVISLMSFPGIDAAQKIQWLLLAVSGFVFLAANTGSWRMIRKYEVRT